MDSPCFDSLDLLHSECKHFFLFFLFWFFQKNSNLSALADIDLNDIVLSNNDEPQQENQKVPLARAVVALQRLKSWNNNLNAPAATATTTMQPQSIAVQTVDWRVSRIPKPSPAWKPRRGGTERDDAPPSSLTRPPIRGRTGHNGTTGSLTTPVSTGPRVKVKRNNVQPGSDELFQRRLEEALQIEEALAFQNTMAIASPPEEKKVSTGWSPVKKAPIPADEEAFAITKKVLHY